jgi:hypothetical protein
VRRRKGAPLGFPPTWPCGAVDLVARTPLCCTRKLKWRRTARSGTLRPLPQGSCHMAADGSTLPRLSGVGLGWHTTCAQGTCWLLSRPPSRCGRRRWRCRGQPAIPVTLSAWRRDVQRCTNTTRHIALHGGAKGEAVPSGCQRLPAQPKHTAPGHFMGTIAYW